MVDANATTSLASAGDFTLQPLRNPFRERLVVMAFMDVLGTGVYNAAVDPAVTVPLSFGGEDLEVELTLQEPAAGAPPVVESELWPFGGADHLLVTFGPATSAGVETAEAYALYWSRSENPGPSNHEGTLTVQAGTSQVGSLGYTVAIPQLEAGAWYVGLAARRAGQESAVKATPFPTQVGEAGGDVMMSGTVHLEGLQAQGALQVVAVSEWMEVSTTRVPVTGTDLSWSFTNLWGGEYTVYVLLDADGDGRFAAHEPGVRSGVRVRLTEGEPRVVPAIVLDAAEVRTHLTTSAWGEYSFDFSSIRTTSEVLLRVLPGSRQPVRVQVTGGEGLPVPFDVPMKDGGFVLREGFQQALPFPAGTTFAAQVEYADGTSESLPLSISGVMPVPVFTSPVGGASSTTPTFVWTLAEGVPESAVQRLEVKSTLSFGGVVWSYAMGAGVRSVEYNADGSGSPLFADGQYGWSYVLEDAHGNRSSLSAIFSTPAE
jgi:hypothetical protein